MNTVNNHLSSLRASGVSEYVAPRTPADEVLAATCAEVLNLNRVGVHDNFFELGGHSLLAMRVIARRMRDAFQVEPPVSKLFEAPTIAQIALIVEDLLIRELESA
jgi:hypothetical protein